eukprot:scaffold4855_cov99-Cylindrotheca_fusiformis.AAC.9
MSGIVRFWGVRHQQKCRSPAKDAATIEKKNNNRSRDAKVSVPPKIYLFEIPSDEEEREYTHGQNRTMGY